MIRPTIVAGLLTALCLSTGYGDDVEVVQLAITPAVRPQPAMRYRLYPAARELQAGNAAALYYRAILHMMSPGRQAERGKLDTYFGMTPSEIPRQEARHALSAYQSAIDEAILAGHRSRAEWDIPLREGGISTLLPELQECRSLARALALKARLDALDGDFQAALESLEAMIVMARHISESGTLISSLVGVAIVGAATAEIQHLAELPGSPNLYWALTALPDPLIDMQTGIESEQLWMNASIPYLNVLESSVLSSQQAAEMADKLGELVVEAGGTIAQNVPPELGLRPTAAALAPALGSYAANKRQLIARGFEPAQVESMPVIQVIVLRWVQTFRDMLDEETAFASRPHAEVANYLNSFDESQQSVSQQPEGFLAGLLLPAVSSAKSAFTRQSQRIALLRVIEALRLHAATHDGKLPGSLAEIDAVPIPLDPATGQAFDYRLDGATAIIRPAQLIIELRYELTVHQ